jgi:hypothetical protein
VHPERFLHRRRALPVQDADGDRLRTLVAESQPEREREQDREREDPEHRLRLAQELAHAPERELEERARPFVTHRAGASP